MKKLSIVLLALIAWAFTSPAYAELQFSNNGTRAGQYRKVNLPAGMSIDASGNITYTAFTATSVVTTGRVQFSTSVYADGDTETSSVLLSSSTSLGTGNMSFSDIYKSIGNANEATVLHDGLSAGQFSRFHILAGNSGKIWTLTPDHALNVNNFNLSVAGTEWMGIFVNSTIGWQSCGGTGTVTIGYKSFAV